MRGECSACGCSGEHHQEQGCIGRDDCECMAFLPCAKCAEKDGEAAEWLRTADLWQIAEGRAAAAEAEVERLTREGMGQMVRADNAEEERDDAMEEVGRLWKLLREHRNALVCANLHHAKKDQHEDGVECPVYARIDAALGEKP